jgi:hypothetical protein
VRSKKEKRAVSKAKVEKRRDGEMTMKLCQKKKMTTF